MKRLLLLLPLLSSVLISPARAHHGPFAENQEGANHALHLGWVAIPDNVTGKDKKYGVRACHLEELDFTRNMPATKFWNHEPFRIRTEQIIAFGLAEASKTPFKTGQSAAIGAVGVLTFNPFTLPLIFLTGGGEKRWNYVIVTINPENERVKQHGIKMFSSKDVGYMNDYLTAATGLTPNEQKGQREIDRMIKDLKDQSSEEQIREKADCSYADEFFNPLPPKPEKKKSKAIPSGRGR